MKNNQPFITTKKLREEFERYFDEKYPNVEKWHYDGYVKVSADFWLSKMSEQKERLIKEVEMDILKEFEAKRSGMGLSSREFEVFVRKHFTQATERVDY